jgi:hypothetical protein
MDMIMMEKVRKIIATGYPGRCVSLFMPAHRAGRETEQDPIRFGNLLSEAEQRLLCGDSALLTLRASERTFSWVPKVG